MDKKQVVISNICEGNCRKSIEKIFAHFESDKKVIKSLEGKIYIKPNTTSSIYYAYTNPLLCASNTVFDGKEIQKSVYY